MKIMINDQIIQQSTILAGVLTTQILQIPNIYQKFNYKRFSYVYIFEYEYLKRFIDNNNNIFAYERNIENRAPFPN